MKRSLALSNVIVISLAATLHAQEAPISTPKAIPATRPEMKIALESLKDRTPRLPLNTESGRGVNNGRMRSQYIPQAWSGGGRGQRTGSATPTENATTGAGGRPARQGGNNGAQSLDYVLTTSMFWVVSRGNNCHYCLGHQELKLKNAGVEDDNIAALDSDWSRFDPRMQAALAYTRKLTIEPQLIGDTDIAKLKEQFSDAEIIELTATIARFNATNRWTDGLGIPQDRAFSDRDADLLTPTSEQFHITTSIVTPNTRASRGPLPTMDQFQQAISAARSRSPRVALPDEAEGRAALAEVIGNRAPLMWERAFAAAGNASQVRSWHTMMTDDNVPPRLKAELALICAIHNRAWYAAAHAASRLTALGASPAELTSLLAGDAPGPAGAAHKLAAKSTADPHLVTDADVAAVQKQYGDAQTAMIMHVICQANMFDRVTEALGLPLEQAVAVKTSSGP